MSNKEQLIYWISERYNVYLFKEAGVIKPWSDDPVFHHTYFCNVHRENDRVTRYIREVFHASSLVDPEFNMMVARMVNKPSSLTAMGWPFQQWEDEERWKFQEVMSQKGSWGSAYIVSTNGRSVPKHEHVIDCLDAAYEPLKNFSHTNTCLIAYDRLKRIYGLASFMSAQIVADLKHTFGHPLQNAEDWQSFVAPGPGSLRGFAWVVDREKITPREFMLWMPWLRAYVDEELYSSDIPKFCNQDLQNCLCEFDKYMRVKNGTGRSKRKYAGV